MAEQTKRPRGGQTIYTDEIAQKIIDRLSEGNTLTEICRSDGMPSRTAVYAWTEERPEFGERFARAKERGFDAIADEALQIANTPINGDETEIDAQGKTVKIKRSDMIRHRMLQIDTRLKLLAKWSPKRYGDRMAMEHTGASGGPIAIAAAAMSDDQLAAIANRKDDE